jgi:hypothetical protein
VEPRGTDVTGPSSARRATILLKIDWISDGNGALLWVTSGAERTPSGPALPGDLPGRGRGGATDSLAQTSEDPMTKPKSRPKAAARSIVRKTARPASRKHPAAAPSKPGAKPDTKHARIIAMLRTPAGATVARMMSTTNWQQHSVRGFLAGIVRKKLGLNLVSELTDKGRVYRIRDNNAASAGASRTKQAA